MFFEAFAYELRKLEARLEAIRRPNVLSLVASSVRRVSSVGRI
jgi:hypothetical protein